MHSVILLAIVIMGPGTWTSFAPEGKNFRVELPGKPNRTSSRPVTTASGRAELTTAELTTAETTYRIQVTENRGRVDPRTFDDGIRQFAEGRGATLGAVKSITIDGNEGREFELTDRTSGRQSRMRWVTSGNALIMLSVAAPPGRSIPAEADRFLDSLTFGGVNAPPANASAERSLERPDGSPTNQPGADDQKKGKGTDFAEEKSAKGEPSKSKGNAQERPGDRAFSDVPKDASPYPEGDLVDLMRSFRSNDRDGFRDIGPAGSLLVGVRVSYIERFGGPKVRSVQPIYRDGTKLYLGSIYGEVVEPVATFVAKPGYAVGGLVTHTGLTVNGFRMVFMKVDGDRLNTTDRYDSDWIGDTKGGGPGEVMSKGQLVVGLQGRSRNEVFALGLTAKR